MQEHRETFFDVSGRDADIFSTDDTFEYYVTFDHPTVWSCPWTLMIPLEKTGERMFEYACHEGNYGLEAILRGAREQEKQSTR